MENRVSKPLKILLLCILLTLLIICCSLFRPRFLYQEGITQLKLKHFQQATASFKKAEQAMPESISTWFARADLFRIYTNYGQALYHLGIKDWKEQGLSRTSFHILTRAKLYLKKAAKIEPEHYINAYWQARTEQGLEKSYAWLHPKKKNLYNAAPYYRKALPLRPSGITIRYSYLQYLQYKRLKAKIPELVRYMMEIHPPSYRYLKKEAFYNDDLIPYIEQGLTQALEKQILPREALKAFSDIYVLKTDFETAISYYKYLLDYKPVLNTSSDYIRMGRLYLKNKDYDTGFIFFEKGFLITKSSTSSINGIYTVFKQEKLLLEFLRFSIFLRDNGLETRGLDMSVAKCWIDMGYPQLARARLIKINARKPHAPAYYLLAMIAQKEKNWDHMEIAIQKASRLDQDNYNYYTLLSRALINQKKYAHAEEVAAKAIQYAPKNNPWVFNDRARIRWTLKKHMAAAEDWEKAFSIKPDRSDFPYRIALAYEHKGLFKQALTFIKKAIALAPDNPTYKALQKRLGV